MTKKLLCACALVVSACGGTGSVAINTFGEEYIEQEIPATDVEDGWRVEYTKFLIALSDIEIGDRAGVVGAKTNDQRIFNMRLAGPTAVTTFDDLDAKRWDNIKVGVKPASGAIAGNAVAADVMMMNQGGLSIYVEGNGSKGATTKTFKWGFRTTTLLADCKEDTGAEGVVVPSGGSVDLQFTIHGDHFVYDGLQNADAAPRFEAISLADANNDGETTLDELAAVDLTNPASPASQYETGGSSVTNLRQFVEALSRTLVHFQGEGECEITN